MANLRHFQFQRVCSNSEFDKNGGKFYRKVENKVGKGEIACYEQFPFFPLSFQNTFTADM